MTSYSRLLVSNYLQSGIASKFDINGFAVEGSNIVSNALSNSHILPNHSEEKTFNPNESRSNQNFYKVNSMGSIKSSIDKSDRVPEEVNKVKKQNFGMNYSYSNYSRVPYNDKSIGSRRPKDKADTLNSRSSVSKSKMQKSNAVKVHSTNVTKSRFYQNEGLKESKSTARLKKTNPNCIGDNNPNRRNQPNIAHALSYIKFDLTSKKLGSFLLNNNKDLRAKSAYSQRK